MTERRKWVNGSLETFRASLERAGRDRASADQTGRAEASKVDRWEECWECWMVDLIPSWACEVFLRQRVRGNRFRGSETFEQDDSNISG
jgi:hypothetical protein